jgi:DNA polymerase-3 subunit alpha
MDNIPMFGDRKNGRADLAYPHPMLEEVLSETYGIFVYQEQVMQAAQVLAGYSLGEADLLRRAMGKKIQSEMDAQRARFIEGCAANDIATPKANELFDLIDKFAGYGFNKSHAAAYALIAYHTAWLKVHHRAEFYAASMSFDMAQTDKLALFVEDARRGGVEVLPPCINSSRADFSVEEGKVRYALGALKGVGEGAMETIVREREANGQFTSMEDFAARIDPRQLNRRQLESLAGAGVFDPINPDRAAVFGGAETILAHATSAADQRTSGQGGLFGGAGVEVASIRLPKGTSWSLAERMSGECEAYGFYFSSHPVDAHKHLLAAHKVRTFAEVSGTPISAEGRTVATMAGLIEEARWRTSAKGRRYMMATLSDSSGQFMATAFEDEVCQALENAARQQNCALLTVELDRREGDETPRVAIKRLQPLGELAEKSRLEMLVHVSGADMVPLLTSVLRPARGGSGALRMTIPLETGGAATMVVGREFRLDAELASQIERICGPGCVELSVQQGPKLALVG